LARCGAAQVGCPERVEFLIKLNNKGLVCTEKQQPVSEVKVIVSNGNKREVS
jgi:hypothetical protein